MIRSVLLGGIALAALIMGAAALRHSARHRAARMAFFLVCLCLAVWSVALEVFLLVPTVSEMDGASRWFYGAAAVFSPATALFMAYTFGRQRPERRWFVGVTAVLTLLLVGYIIAAPEFIISRYSGSATAELTVRHDNYMLFSAFFCAYFLAAIGVGARAWRRATGIKRKQVATYIVGLVLASLPGFMTNLWLPATGNYSLIWVGPVGVVGFLAPVMYGMVRYRMMDMRLATARTVAYLLFAISMAVAYFIAVAVITIIAVASQQAAVPTVSLLNIVLAVIIALAFQPAKRFFDAIADRLFYSQSPRQDDFSREVGRILSRGRDLRLLLRRAGSYIGQSLHAERVSFYIAGRGIFGPRRRRVAVEDDIKQILTYYHRHYTFPEAVCAHQITDPSLQRLFALHRTAMAIPLVQHSRDIGILFIGEHKSRGFSARDIRMVEAIASELSAAVANALAIDEVQRLNETLQQKVDAATKELRASNRQLLRLDEAKNEFISMASHQLRTPLTSIKGYLDMVLEGDLGRITPTQRTVLKEAFSSSERMVRLINDFLNVSRLQTGKFVIDRRPANLATIIKEEVALIEVVAKQRNIAIELTIEGDMPPLLLDEEKIRQVAMNFMDNAVYYSHPDTVITVRLAREKNEVIFTVKDTGIGVPKAEQADLFGKFFRATNARKRRPDGTGVGLFLARKVILSHEGEIIFTSEEGKGSTFGFRLPL